MEKFYRRKSRFFSSEEFYGLTVKELKELLTPMGMTVEEALLVYQRLLELDPKDEYEEKIEWLNSLVKTKEDLYMEFRP